MDTSNIFANTATTSKSVVDANNGGSMFSVPPTDGYQAVIKHAYLIPNKNTPANTDLHIRFKLDQGYQWDLALYSVLINKSPFSTKLNKDGSKQPTFGFSRASRIVSAATKGLDLETIGGDIQLKTILLYDYDQGKELPKEVHMLQSLVGQTVLLGLTRKIQNKKTLENGEWIELPEKVQRAELGAIASIDGFTKSEYDANATVPKALNEWITNNQGKDWDAYNPVGNVVGNAVGGTDVTAPVDFSL